MRYKIKEIICENPANMAYNIRIMTKEGETIGTCNEGVICFGRNKENISFTFHDDNLYLEKHGDNWFLIKDE